MKYIGSNAFNQCSSLEYITIPSSVTRIGDRAFYRCSSLKSIVISSSYIYIGDLAFDGCSSLKNVEILSFKAYIGNYAFISCSSLVYIKILSHLLFLGIEPFSNNSSIENILIPFTLDQFLENCPNVDLSNTKYINVCFFPEGLSHPIIEPLSMSNDLLNCSSYISNVPNENAQIIGNKAFTFISHEKIEIFSSPLNPEYQYLLSFLNIDALLKWYEKWKSFYKKLNMPLFYENLKMESLKRGGLASNFFKIVQKL